MTNSKRVFKRVLASLLVAVMVVGIAPMTGFVDLFGTDAQAASCVYEYPIRTVCNTGDGYKSNHIRDRDCERKQSHFRKNIDFY